MNRTGRIGFVQSFPMVVLGLCLSFSSNAETTLEVELETCVWQEEDAVICSFEFVSAASENYSITGGQYSVGVDGSGNTWQATRIRVGENSGLAVGFSLSPGSVQQVEVWFGGMGRAVKKFKTLTLRFNDGYWQAKDVPVTVH